MPLSKELIQQLREMEAKATIAPWEVWESVDEYHGHFIGAGPIMIPTVRHTEEYEVDRKNIRFLIALRNNAVALISAAEECERLREEVDRLKAQHDDLVKIANAGF